MDTPRPTSHADKLNSILEVLRAVNNRLASIGNAFALSPEPPGVPGVTGPYGIEQSTDEIARFANLINNQANSIAERVGA